MSTIPVFDEETKRNAYMKGLQLKRAGLDAETIYARLEKQGIPPQLAQEVAWNISLQRKEEALNQLPVTGFRLASGFAQIIRELTFWKKKKK